MAKIDPLIKLIFKWEGKSVTHQDMEEVILRPHYWDLWQADHILNQSIANLLVDWTWCGGKRSITFVQNILNVTQDGIVGKETITAINSHHNQEVLFFMIKMNRIMYIHGICKEQIKLNRFKREWLNRIADFSYR